MNSDIVAMTIMLILSVAFIITGLVIFLRKPREEQLKAINEWLKWAVCMAEKELGSGTGALKLRYVWELATSRFEWVTELVTFDDFSNMVDTALEWMRLQLENNDNVKAIIERD